MKRSVLPLLEQFANEVVTAVYHAGQGGYQKLRWSTDTNYRELVKKAGTWQNMKLLLETQDCPTPLQISRDTAKLKIRLEDKAVANLISEVRLNIKEELNQVKRRKMLHTEGIQLQWHARQYHIFGQSSVTSFIACCSEVPDMELALNTADLLGRYPVSVSVWRSLLVTARESKDFTEATNIIANLSQPNSKLLKVYLQCAVATNQCEKTILEILQNIPQSTFTIEHAEIALKGTNSLENFRLVQQFIYDNNQKASSKIDKHAIRILLKFGKVSECEEIAALQRVISNEVHGQLRMMVPKGMTWINRVLSESGLKINYGKGSVVENKQEEVVDQNQFEDKKMLATVSVGQGAFATALAMKASPAAVTVPFAAPVAMCSAVAGSGPNRDKSTITTASLIGSAAWAGAALAGTPPVAAGVVGSLISYSTARMLSLKRPTDSPPSVIQKILKFGNTVYEGRFRDVVSILTSSPIPLYIKLISDFQKDLTKSDSKYSISVEEPALSKTKLLRISDDVLDKTLEWIKEKTFKVVKDRDVFVFTVYFVK